LVVISPNPNANNAGQDQETEKHVGRRTVIDQNLERMSNDELWTLHEDICAILSAKLVSEKNELERRLAKIKGRNEINQRARRPYPKVYPKYRNPERPYETWSGRGKQPRWVSAQLSSGKKVGDLLISRPH
jgi:DNA-binding protein H-NS